jgi:hypothetical protein
MTSSLLTELAPELRISWARWLARFGQGAPRRRQVVLGVEPASVDGIDAHVRAVGGADGGAEDLLEVRGHLQPLGEIDEALAAGEGLMATDQGQEGIERGLSLLLALERVGEADHVGEGLGLGTARVVAPRRGGAARGAAQDGVAAALGDFGLQVRLGLGERGLFVGDPLLGPARGRGDGRVQLARVSGEGLEQGQALVDAEHRDEGVGTQRALQKARRRPGRQLAAFDAELVEDDRHEVHLARGIRPVGDGRALHAHGLGLDPAEAVDLLWQAVLDHLDLFRADVGYGATLLVANDHVEQDGGGAGGEGRGFLGPGGRLWTCARGQGHADGQQDDQGRSLPDAVWLSPERHCPSLSDRSEAHEEKQRTP